MHGRYHGIPFISRRISRLLCSMQKFVGLTIIGLVGWWGRAATNHLYWNTLFRVRIVWHSTHYPTDDMYVYFICEYAAQFWKWQLVNYSSHIYSTFRCNNEAAALTPMRYVLGFGFGIARCFNCVSGCPSGGAMLCNHCNIDYSKFRVNVRGRSVRYS